MQNIRIRNNKPYADEDSLHINRLSRNARKYMLQNAGKSLDLEEKFNLLIKYYTRYANCPPPVDGSEFLRICNKHRFDPALALAQAFVESRIGTGGGLSEVTKNMMNIGNWNTEKGNKRKAFKSWEDGIAVYCQQMKRYFPHRAEELFKNNFTLYGICNITVAKDLLCLQPFKLSLRIVHVSVLLIEHWA